MSTKTVAVWDNKSAPGGATNTLRGLTHRLDLTERQDAMKATRGCSIEGCERVHYCRAMCKIHYERLTRRGRIDTLPILSVPVRLAAGLVTTPGGCHEWRGHTREGYGRLSVNGKQVDTHRLAWTLTNGPIPKGMWVLHRCDNPPCCNPAHLFLGTQADNNIDMSNKGRNNSQQKTHCPQDHPYSESNTYLDTAGRRRCRTCRAAQASTKGAA